MLEVDSIITITAASRYNYTYFKSLESDLKEGKTHHFNLTAATIPRKALLTSPPTQRSPHLPSHATLSSPPFPRNAFLTSLPTQRSPHLPSHATLSSPPFPLIAGTQLTGMHLYKCNVYIVLNIIVVTKLSLYSCSLSLKTYIYKFS